MTDRRERIMGELLAGHQSLRGGKPDDPVSLVGRLLSEDLSEEERDELLQALLANRSAFDLWVTARRNIDKQSAEAQASAKRPKAVDDEPNWWQRFRASLLPQPVCAAAAATVVVALGAFVYLGQEDASWLSPQRFPAASWPEERMATAMSDLCLDVTSTDSELAFQVGALDGVHAGLKRLAAGNAAWRPALARVAPPETVCDEPRDVFTSQIAKGAAWGRWLLEADLACRNGIVDDWRKVGGITDSPLDRQGRAFAVPQDCEAVALALTRLIVRS